MKTIRQNLANFQRCRQLLTSFQQKGAKMDMRQFHSFIGWADRNTLRMQCNFKPLQTMMGVMSSRVVNDPFVANKPLMMAKMSSIYRFLNYCNFQWINHSLLRTKIFIDNQVHLYLEDVLPIYQMCIQLGEVSSVKEMTLLRQKSVELLMADIGNIPKPKKLEQIHKHLRVFLNDPNPQISGTTKIVKKLQNICQNQTLSLSKDYNYVHSAMIYQLLDIFNIPVKQEYQKFLSECYHQYKSTLINTENTENSDRQFARRGQSVFQIRFQKHLQENGYWFQRNKVIGLHQFDILIKGTLSKEYYPFEKLKHGSVSDIPVISREELSQFEKMDNLWKIEKQEPWGQNILVNLNGPFHEVIGDKSGTVRSQEMKGLFANSHGFNKFKVINYRDWQEKTPNKRSVTQYLKQMISSCQNI